MDQQKDDVTASSATLSVAGGDATIRRILHDLARGTAPALALAEFDTVEVALAHSPEMPVLVPVRMPLDHLHRALQAGEAPEPALAAWRERHEAVLRSCRKARRRVLVIDAGMFATHPGDCARTLGDRLGLRFATPPAPEAPADPELAPVHAAIAASLLAGDAQVREMADELEAMVLGPVSPRSPAREELASAAETVAGFVEERDLLRENLKQMLAELEELRAALARSEEQASTLETQRAEDAAALKEARTALESAQAETEQSRTEVAQLHATLAQTSEANDMLTEERDLLRENLGHMLEETEKLLADQSAREEAHLLRAQLEAVNRQLEDARERARGRDAVLGREILRLAAREREALAQAAQARDEIAQLHASTSWKVTRPMRAVRRGIARG